MTILTREQIAKHAEPCGCSVCVAALAYFDLRDAVLALADNRDARIRDVTTDDLRALVARVERGDA